MIYKDNTGCIQWSKNPADHQQSKHVDLKYHFVRAKVKEGEAKLVYCPTEEMMADILTKYLSATRFAYLREKMVWVNHARVKAQVWGKHSLVTSGAAAA